MKELFLILLIFFSTFIVFILFMARRILYECTTTPNSGLVSGLGKNDDDRSPVLLYTIMCHCRWKILRLVPDTPMVTDDKI
jgi:hypothetical protein